MDLRTKKAESFSPQSLCPAGATKSSKQKEVVWEQYHLRESGCAYHGITVIVTNLLMKVQHVAVSENSVHGSFFTVIWTWNFLLSSANVTESAAWIEVTRPWFVRQIYREHWKCVSVADYLVAEM